tara:strand:- start:436 stop:666 length:231 start_codon:yes stop_codon:yes gene_type:complete
MYIYICVGRSIIRDIPIETLLENITPDPSDCGEHENMATTKGDTPIQQQQPQVSWKKSLRNAQMFNDIEIRPGMLR